MSMFHSLLGRNQSLMSSLEEEECWNPPSLLGRGSFVDVDCLKAPSSNRKGP